MRNYFDKFSITWNLILEKLPRCSYQHMNNFSKYLKGRKFKEPCFSFPCWWFSLNNSETVKAVILVFCSIQWHFIENTRVKFGILDWPLSLDIGKSSDRGISDFRVSVQFFINENCHNSRTSHDIDMKLPPVTMLDKRNTATSKTIDNDVISKIVTSLSYFQLLANLEQFGYWILDA